MVQQYIYDLLLDNDCVVVPGLGGFICQYHPAAIDHRKGLMTPPGRSVAFNRALQQNDGLLTQHISVAEAISYKMAEDKVREFVSHCNQRLHQHGSVLLQGIGRLYMDDLKHIQFTPAAELLPLDAAYGLTALQVQPVARLKDLAAAVPQKEEGIVVPLNKRETAVVQKSWPYWVAASVAAVFLSATLWINANQPGVAEGLRAGFSLQTKEMAHAPTSHAVNSQPVEVFKQKEELKEVETNDVLAQNTLQKYPIVVGAFRGPVSAGRYAEELAARGYDASVIDPGKNMWLKVVVHVAAEDEETALKTIRSEVEPHAWVLH